MPCPTVTVLVSNFKCKDFLLFLVYHLLIFHSLQRCLLIEEILLLELSWKHHNLSHLTKGQHSLPNCHCCPQVPWVDLECMWKLSNNISIGKGVIRETSFICRHPLGCSWQVYTTWVLQPITSQLNQPISLHRPHLKHSTETLFYLILMMTSTKVVKMSFTNISTTILVQATFTQMTRLCNQTDRFLITITGSDQFWCW